MTKVQILSTTIKDSRIEESKKAQKPKLTNNSSGNTETSEKAWKESKKRFWKEKRKQKNFSSNTPATEDNTTSNNIGLKGPKKNLSKITYYNYNKEGHYTRTCFKSKKSNVQKN